MFLGIPFRNLRLPLSNSAPHQPYLPRPLALRRLSIGQDPFQGVMMLQQNREDNIRRDVQMHQQNSDDNIRRDEQCRL